MNRKFFLTSRIRTFFLLVGLIGVTIGVLLITAASQTRIVVAEQNLNQYWRTTYDILVRPSGSRTSIEEKYGLVEVNQLSGIWGGITFNQYDAIKSIPGVQVAAPIAMIGYMNSYLPVGDLQFPSKPGLYVLEMSETVNDGIHSFTPPDYPRRIYYFFTRNPQEPPNEPFSGTNVIGNIIVNSTDVATGSGVDFPFLISGIDPVQEAALVGLDKTVVTGTYLLENESLAPTITIEPKPTDPIFNLPILLNTMNYINFSAKSVLGRVILPSEVDTIDQIQAMGGTGYLSRLPFQTISSVEADSRTLYQKMFSAIAPQFIGVEAPLGPSMIPASTTLESPPSSIIYSQAHTQPKNYDGIVLDLVPPSNPIGKSWPEYRTKLANLDLKAIFMWDPKGIFDIGRLQKQADINRVPLETYFPPIALLRYDDQGNIINPPIQLNPTLNPTGYIQSPPLILTTLDAARAMWGNSVISAIRIRVALQNCPPEQSISCSITPSSVRKIQTVAIEIQRRTGLDVDIMVGSSPKRVLVHVPGVGYVEEQWVQKGVNLTYKQGIQSGNWLLLGMLLIFGGFFSLNLTWTDVVSRRRVIALQKALGWRSSSIFTQVLGQVFFIGIAATLLGVLAAIGVILMLNWRLPSKWLIAGLPLAILGITTVGSLGPAWMASRIPPVIGLQSSGLHNHRKSRWFGFGLWDYAWNVIGRQPTRAVLAGFAVMFSASLLVLLLAILRGQNGMLSGTLLGEFILVHIELYHFAILVIGIGLSVLSTTNGLLAGVIERQREIAILKSLGWKTSAVTRLFLIEGVILGLLGGALGSILATIILWSLYQSISQDLYLAYSVGVFVSGLIGALSAIYPAYRASHIMPAEAIRYE